MDAVGMGVVVFDKTGEETFDGDSVTGRFGQPTSGVRALDRVERHSVGHLLLGFAFDIYEGTIRG
jgi:hypothetical protein